MFSLLWYRFKKWWNSFFLVWLLSARNAVNEDLRRCWSLSWKRVVSHEMSWVMKCHGGCFAIQSKCKRVTDGLRRKFVKQSYLNSCSLKRFQLPCHDWWTNGLVLQVDSRLLFGDSDRLLAGKLWQIMANCLLKLQGDCETKTTLNYKILVARTKLKFLISWKGKITIYIYYT